MAASALVDRLAGSGRSPALLGGSVAVCAAGYLLARLAPDVADKALSGDEAVAGLVAVRPLGEAIATAMWERGGAPLHFVLAHFALAVDPSPEALRWVSVVFALAAVGVTYDLGRRLGGHGCGAVAAVVAASSTLLAVYGAFGRMYALFAFAGALAGDLLLRALRVRTLSSALAAAGAAVLLPAVHPYGAFPAFAIAVVSVAVWRGRPLLPAVPVALVGLLAVPLLLADLRLADRFDLGASVRARERVLEPDEVPEYAVDVLQGIAGGHGWTFVALLAVGLVGLASVVRTEPAFAAFGVLAGVLPLLFLLVARTGPQPYLSTRHFIFALPLWAAAIGAGAVRLGRDWGPGGRAAVLVAAGAAALVSPPDGIERGEALPAAPPGAFAAASNWVRTHVREDDVLYPYSTLFLEALPATRHATVLTSRGPGDVVVHGLRRVEFPVRDLLVAVRLSTEADIDPRALDEELGAGYEIMQFGPWLLVSAEGRIEDERALLRRALAIVEGIDSLVDDWGNRKQYRQPLCVGLASLGDACA